MTLIVNVWSYFCHHHQANKEASNANDEKEDFPVMARVEEGGVHVGDRSCQSLQTYKLHQHQNTFCWIIAI